MPAPVRTGYSGSKTQRDLSLRPSRRLGPSCPDWHQRSSIHRPSKGEQEPDRDFAVNREGGELQNGGPCNAPIVHFHVRFSTRREARVLKRPPNPLNVLWKENDRRGWPCRSKSAASDRQTSWLYAAQTYFSRTCFASAKSAPLTSLTRNRPTDGGRSWALRCLPSRACDQ